MNPIAPVATNAHSHPYDSVMMGTISGVSNLSGYCFNKSGRIMVFSTLMGSVGDLGYAHLNQDRQIP